MQPVGTPLDVNSKLLKFSDEEFMNVQKGRCSKSFVVGFKLRKTPGKTKWVLEVTLVCHNKVNW